MVCILAAKLSNKVTAVASVSCGMVPEVFDSIMPVHAIPALEIHGAEDGVVPYDGSNMQFSSVNTDTMVRFRTRNNICALIADASALPDVDSSDASTVQLFIYPNGTDDAQSRLYRVIGQNHLN